MMRCVYCSGKSTVRSRIEFDRGGPAINLAQAESDRFLSTTNRSEVVSRVTPVREAKTVAPATRVASAFLEEHA